MFAIPDLPVAGVCHVSGLRKAARRLSLVYDAAIAPCGLKMTQAAILTSVARAEDPTMGELAATLVLDRSALTENLKPLVRKGLLEVRVCVQDKRIRRVALTAAGAAKVTEYLPLWRSAQARFEAIFGADAASALRLELSQIIADDFVSAFENARV